MNIYEQLQAVKQDLERQGAKAKTLRVVDNLAARAEPQRDSGLNFTRLQVLRRVMQTPEVLNDEDVRLDLIALEGDLEEAAAQRAEAEPAYEAPTARPKLKKYYKKK
ncbi:MAG TPA: hypothetical protein VKX16_18745 [Chloroflexota bacterium]|nr:hypothetical protein [Chloroflexota bacterium]